MKKKYALIGYPLTHSFSQKYFQQKFINENIIDSEFVNYSIENIEEIKDILLKDESLKGFCITIPHKKNILPYLHAKTDAVKKMNACNCVQIKNGKWIGHNTDIIGFEKSFITHLLPFHNKALILGTGGAAAAVAYVLGKLNIPFKFVSRKKNEDYFTYSDLDQNVMKEYNIIINASPIGTYPKVNEAPPIPYEYLCAQHYLYDLVYNPSKTKFLKFGEEKGALIQNGYPMLSIQAEENWKIWNS